ncbi:MAG: hypothetical protein RL768_2371 [Nitrospirota bacterium]
MLQWRTVCAAVGGVLLLGFPALTVAHEHLENQIARMSVLLKNAPDRPELYVKRGELYRLHEEWEAALADCDRAAALAPSLEAVDILRGRVLLSAGRAGTAEDVLRRVLNAHPNHPQALLLHAEALEQLGQFEQAAVDAERGLVYLPQPDPDEFFKAARLSVKAGRVEQAIGILDRGIQQLGGIASLQRAAIDLELRRGDVEAGLARLERLAAASLRKETFWAERGDILKQAGRAQEADQAYRAALTALESLTAALRRTPAIIDLESHVRSALTRE